jgi:hypothetical protein
MLLAIYIESEPFALEDLACFSKYPLAFGQDIEVRLRFITRFTCKAYEPHDQREIANRGSRVVMINAG